jgi:hypothetical protein
VEIALADGLTIGFWIEDSFRIVDLRGTAAGAGERIVVMTLTSQARGRGAHGEGMIAPLPPTAKRVGHTGATMATTA